MRLNSSGNLGLGTTSPTAKLHVVNSTPNSGRQTLFLDSSYGNTGDSAASIRATLNNNAGGTYIWGLTSESVLAHNMEFISGSNWVARSTTASYLSQAGGVFVFYSNQSLTASNTFTPTERLRLTSGGDLQLGGTQGTTPALGRGMYVESTTGIVGYSLYVNNGVNNRRGSMFLDNTSGVWGWDVTASSGIPYYVWRVAGSEKMRLTDDGRLALAEGNAPTQVLSLYRGGSTNAIMSAGNSNTGLDGTWFGVDTAGNGIVNVRGAFPLLFSTSATERARITSGGDFGIGNSNPGYRLTVDKNTTSALAFFTNSNASTPNGLYIDFSAASPDNNTQYFFVAEDSTAIRCYIYSDGDLANHDGVYGTISDQRLKQDIVDAGSQWDDLKAVRFRKYRMKTDVQANPDAPAMLGVVAQELEAVCPGLVDEHTDTDGETTKTVKSSILLMTAAVALQEAMARIETLEAKVTALEAKQ